MKYYSKNKIFFQMCYAKGLNDDQDTGIVSNFSTSIINRMHTYFQFVRNYYAALPASYHNFLNFRIQGFLAICACVMLLRKLIK